jgi:hypothetical protein
MFKETIDVLNKLAADIDLQLSVHEDDGGYEQEHRDLIGDLADISVVQMAKKVLAIPDKISASPKYKKIIGVESFTTPIGATSIEIKVRQGAVSCSGGDGDLQVGDVLKWWGGRGLEPLEFAGKTDETIYLISWIEMRGNELD